MPIPLNHMILDDVPEGVHDDESSQEDALSPRGDENDESDVGDSADAGLTSAANQITEDSKSLLSVGQPAGPTPEMDSEHEAGMVLQPSESLDIEMQEEPESSMDSKTGEPMVVSPDGTMTEDSVVVSAKRARSPTQGSRMHRIPGEKPEDPERERKENSRKRRPPRRQPLQIAAANQKDDFTPRGRASPLTEMGIFMYSTFIRRRKKEHLKGDEITFPFEEHYVLSREYVQELRRAPSIVQLDGFNLPTEIGDAEENARLKCALFSGRPRCGGPSKGQRNCAAPELWTLHNCGFHRSVWKHRRAEILTVAAEGDRRLLASRKIGSLLDTWWASSHTGSDPSFRIYWPSYSESLPASIDAGDDPRS